MSIAMHANFSIALATASLSSASFGTPMLVGSHTVTANRQDGPYSTLAAFEAAGFTSVATPVLHAQASAIAAQRPRATQWMVGRIDVGDADLTAALTAIEAVAPASWYCTLIDTRTDADIALLAAWVETRAKIAVAQSSAAGLLDGTGIGQTLATAGYNRTSIWYHDDDTEALDGGIAGRCLGFALDAPNGSGSWMGHQLVSVPGSPLTVAQKTAMLADYSNWYSPVTFTSGVDSVAFAYPGRMPSGRSIKIQTSLDWLQARLEESFLNVFLQAASSNQPAVLFTDAGIARIQAAGMRVFSQGVTGGHFIGNAVSDATGLVTPYLKVPKESEISAANKQAGVLSGMTAELVVAPEILGVGNASTVGLTIDLSF